MPPDDLTGSIALQAVLSSEDEDEEEEEEIIVKEEKEDSEADVPARKGSKRAGKRRK